jgi:LmbE family N-acetylglucosaminyl deacetylase
MARVDAREPSSRPAFGACPASTILVIAPHSDDEVLGVGGTIARLSGEGRRVVVAVVTKGYEPDFPQALIDQGRDEAKRAHELLGVGEAVFLDLPAARLDTVAHADVNVRIGSLVDEVRPATVFVPFAGDVHLDHQLVALSAMVCCRPCCERMPSAVYAYETLSETNWNAPYITPAFQPNTYFDISSHLATKLDALRAFSTQMRPFPNERSIEAAEHLARLRGCAVGLPAAEAFVLLRQVVR